jgi:hypothetical protein
MLKWDGWFQTTYFDHKKKTFIGMKNLQATLNEKQMAVSERGTSS